jgi:hypothetical protein
MYVYRADTYCDSCGEAIAAQLTREGLAPLDPTDEHTYDSDSFPKGSYPEEATDGPDHCASDACLEAVELGAYGLGEDAPLVGAETRTVGALLSDGLTEHGAAYLAEMLAESDLTPYQRALHAFWREAFADELVQVEDAALLDRARALGEERGRAAASWYFDGNTPDAAYAQVLAGIEEGDPAILDTFPADPLSGEWADDPTPKTLLEGLGLDLEDERADDLCGAYEDGFYSASAHEIERVARYHVAA